MTAKEYLSQIRKIDTLIKNKELQLEEIRNKMRGISSISFDSDGSVTCTRNITSPQARWIYKYIEYQKDLTNALDELIKVKNEVASCIDELNNPYHIELLYKRYFQFLKWEEIAIDMYMSYRQVLRIHGEALKCVGDKLN